MKTYGLLVFAIFVAGAVIQLFHFFFTGTFISTPAGY